MKDPIAIVQPQFSLEVLGAKLDMLLEDVSNKDEEAERIHREYREIKQIADDKRYQAGLVFLQVRKMIPERGPNAKKWGEFVAERGISLDTAARYIKIAEHAQLNPDAQFKSLIEVYRELGLKPDQKSFPAPNAVGAGNVDNFPDPKVCEDPLKIATSQIPPPAFSFGPGLDPELEILPSGLIVPRDRSPDLEQRYLLQRLSPKEADYLQTRLTSAQKQEQRALIERLAPAKPTQAGGYTPKLPGPAGEALAGKPVARAAPDDAPPSDAPKITRLYKESLLDEPEDDEEEDDEPEIEEAPAPPPDAKISDSLWASLMDAACRTGENDAKDQEFACADALALWERLRTADDPELGLTQKRKLLAAYQRGFGQLRLKPDPAVQIEELTAKVAELMRELTEARAWASHQEEQRKAAELELSDERRKVEQLQKRVRELESPPAPRAMGWTAGTPVIIATTAPAVPDRGRRGVIVDEYPHNSSVAVYLYPAGKSKPDKRTTTGTDGWLLLDSDTEPADAISRALASQELSKEQRRTLEALAKGAAP